LPLVRTSNIERVSRPVDAADTFLVRRRADQPGVELWLIRGTTRPWTGHQTVQVVGTSSAPASVYQDGQAFSLPARAVFILAPHALWLTRGEGPADHTLLLVPGPHLASTSGGALGGARASTAAPGVVVDHPEVTRAFTAVAESFEIGSARRPACTTEELVRLVAERAASAPLRRPPEGCDRAVRLARDLIERRFQDPLSLDEIAGAAGISKFHLARSFVDRVGVPVCRYLRTVRVGHALALLRAGWRPADVVEAVGFVDQPHLTRVLRHHVGFTPGAYRSAPVDPEVARETGDALPKPFLRPHGRRPSDEAEGPALED
jgi:AraC-like DNA-binding protein